MYDDTRNSTKEKLWHMKEIEKDADAGLTAIYALLREQGLFEKDGKKNLPKTELIDKGYFEVSATQWEHPYTKALIPTVKVMATIKGRLFILEKGREVARRKEKSSDKQPRVRSSSNDDKKQGPICGHHTERQAAGHAR